MSFKNNTKPNYSAIAQEERQYTNVNTDEVYSDVLLSSQKNILTRGDVESTLSENVLGRERASSEMENNVENVDSESFQGTDTIDGGNSERSPWIQPIQEFSLPEFHAQIPVPRTGTPWYSALRAYLGPGTLVAVGYMDPGNWVSFIYFFFIHSI
jgi:hypothetical protein